MRKCRLLFEKGGRAKFISHLDLMRTFQRAFVRADIPLRHTGGFNPHPDLSLVLPLPLGCESLCELLDFEPASDALPLEQIPARLNAVLPEGIVARSAAPRGLKPGALKYLRCELLLCYDSGAPEPEAIDAFWRRETVEVLRKTKRGESVLDLRPHVRQIAAARVDSTHLRLTATVSAQEPTVNPLHLSAALTQLAPELAPDFASPRRLEVYDENMDIFR